MQMSDFLSGVEEKYPELLLKGRLTVEGNVIGCFFQDPLLLDETTCTPDDFITEDGRFYFNLIKMLRNKNVNIITDVDIIQLGAEIYEAYDQLGGWETVEHLKEVINLKNFDAYIDTFYRENIFLKMYSDGFSLTQPIEIDGKMRIPLKFLRKCSAEEVIDWWESRLTTYGNGYSSRILEEEEIDFSDEFFESCEEGEENGVPFRSAGIDINGEEIYCYGFLSNQANGFLDGTLNVLGGYSSVGKSSWWIAVIMSLIHQGRKVLIISNEESIKKYKIKFLVWLLGKRNRYFALTKKKLMSGQITEEDRVQLKDIQNYWRENYKSKVKFIAIPDADMKLVKKKIRENVLRYGYNVALYDTLKLDFNTAGDTRQDLSLVKDARELDSIAKKYNIIVLASLQLAIHTKGQLFLNSSVLSQSKQCVEVMENLFLMRNAYALELDKNSKYYCHPFKRKKVDSKWVEEECDVDPTRVYRILFPDKVRSGTNSNDDGVCYLISFDGDHTIFREQYLCRPQHGRIE